MPRLSLTLQQDPLTLLKKLLLASSVLFATPVLAQSFPKPPDVPEYVEYTPTFSTNNAVPNETIDPTVTPPPAYSTQPDNILPGNAGWKVTCGESTCGGRITASPPGEQKFRTTLQVTHVLYDDPIRNYGQPGTSHCHMFFGNARANAFSTYADLREHQGASRAAGGEENATGYWFPCFILTDAFGDGKNYAAIPGTVSVYYVEQPGTPRLTGLARGVRYVTGWNMDEGTDAVQAMVNAANAASLAAGGSGSRYTRHNPASPESAHGTVYQCLEDGVMTDEQDNLEDLTCGAADDGANVDEMIVSFVAPAMCWDGINFWSPGGYAHVFPAIFDTQFGELVCPTNSYRIPDLQVKLHFRKHEGTGAGPRNLNHWTLSSDPAFPTRKNGQTFHTDWMDGWNHITRQAWEQQCVGTNGGTPRSCSDSSIGDGTILVLGATPVGFTPSRAEQVDVEAEFPTSSPTTMFELPSSNPSGLHLHGDDATILDVDFDLKDLSDGN